jgi:tetratricopeptide (TPR) repeat protein
MIYAAEGLGSIQAASWLADNLGDRSQLSNWPTDTQDEYEKWLTFIVEHESNSSLALKALADLYRVRGEIKRAYETLLQLEQEDSSVPPLLVMLEKQLGLDQKARVRARELVESNLALLRDVPDLVDVRIQTAQMLVFLGKKLEATKLLIERDRSPGVSAEEKQALGRPIADGLVLLANDLAASENASRGLMRRLEYLQTAVGYDPTSRAVLNAVLEACLEVSESKNNELLIMREAIVQGVSTDAAHFITGTVALLEGDVDAALHHLDIAAEKNLNMPGVLNNLAYALCQQDDPDLERALRLSEAAVRSSPDNAYVLETRGQILLQMGRWKEAISDLEVALQVDELKRLARPGLALAYEQLGQSEIAARHRELVSQGR